MNGKRLKGVPEVNHIKNIKANKTKLLKKFIVNFDIYKYLNINSRIYLRKEKHVLFYNTSFLL
jgi:hypothetical protein